MLPAVYSVRRTLVLLVLLVAITGCEEMERQREEERQQRERAWAEAVALDDVDGYVQFMLTTPQVYNARADSAFLVTLPVERGVNIRVDVAGDSSFAAWASLVVHRDVAFLAYLANLQDTDIALTILVQRLRSDYRVQNGNIWEESKSYATGGKITGALTISRTGEEPLLHQELDFVMGPRREFRSTTRNLGVHGVYVARVQPFLLRQFATLAENPIQFLMRASEPTFQFSRESHEWVLDPAWLRRPGALQYTMDVFRGEEDDGDRCLAGHVLGHDDSRESLALLIGAVRNGPTFAGRVLGYRGLEAAAAIAQELGAIDEELAALPRVTLRQRLYWSWDWSGNHPWLQRARLRELLKQFPRTGDAIEPLIGLLEASNRDTAKWAQKALRRRVNGSFGTDAAEWRNWYNEEGRAKYSNRERGRFEYNCMTLTT